MAMSHEEHVRAVFGRELAKVRDAALREKVVRTWVRAMQLSGATDLDHDLPFLKTIAKPGIGVEHVRCVVHLALAIADTLAAAHGAQLDRDVVAAGALLHDVGKLLEHAPDERHVLAGPLVRHAFSGVHLAVEEGLPREVLHIIAYHSLEGQRLRRTPECEAVYRADFISLDALARRELGKSGHEVMPYVYLPAHL
jgi:putative nucleotidyltransferase with HDIG domain